MGCDCRDPRMFNTGSSVIIPLLSGFQRRFDHYAFDWFVSGCIFGLLPRAWRIDALPTWTGGP